MAPAPTPFARLATGSTGQRGPARAVLPNGRELLATHGTPVADGDPDEAVLTVWDVRHRRILRTIRTVSAQALVLAAAPDAHAYAATLDVDGAVRAWDALTGRRLFKRQGWPRSGLTLASLADGTPVLATGVDYRVRVRDLRTGDRLFDLPVASQRIPALGTARLADGRTLLAAATGARVTVWDLDERRPLHSLAGHRLPVAALALHALPDGGAVLAAATGQRVHIWDPLDGVLRHTLVCRLEPPPSGAGLASLALADLDDGRVLAAYAPVASGDVWVWDAGSGAPQAGIPAGQSPTCGITFLNPPPAGGPSADAGGASGCAALAVSTGVNVRLWALAAVRADPVTAGLATQPASVDETPGRVTALGFVPGAGGRAVLASAHAGGTLCLRDPATGREIRRLGTGGDVAAIAAPGPSLIAASGRAVTVWDPATGRELAHHRWSGPPRLSGLAVTAAADGTPLLVLVRTLDRLALWDPIGDGLVCLLPDRARVPRCLAAARRADGRGALASGSYDGAVQVWDLDAGRVVRTLVPHLAPVRSVALAPDPAGGLTVFSGDDAGTIRIWDADTGALLGVRPEAGSPVSALAAHAPPDGGLALAAAVDTALLRWSAHPAATRLGGSTRDAAAT
jgi:WD40 repeat protein